MILSLSPCSASICPFFPIFSVFCFPVCFMLYPRSDACRTSKDPYRLSRKSMRHRRGTGAVSAIRVPEPRTISDHLVEWLPDYLGFLMVSCRSEVFAWEFVYLSHFVTVWGRPRKHCIHCPSHGQWHHSELQARLPTFGDEAMNETTPFWLFWCFLHLQVYEVLQRCRAAKVQSSAQIQISWHDKSWQILTFTAFHRFFLARFSSAELEADAHWWQRCGKITHTSFLFLFASPKATAGCSEWCVGGLLNPNLKLPKSTIWFWHGYPNFGSSEIKCMKRFPLRPCLEPLIESSRRRLLQAESCNVRSDQFLLRWVAVQLLSQND